MTWQPKDQLIRDQIISDENNQVITAGAGSGKTTLIVEKYMALLEKGVSPQRIAAITFTNKSASELKHRLLTRHQELFPESSSLPVGGLPISTIHGFCKRIIQPFALTLGYLPDFTVEQDQILEKLQATFEEQLPSAVSTFPDLLLWKLLGWMDFKDLYRWAIDLSLHKMTLAQRDLGDLEMPDFQVYGIHLKENLINCTDTTDKLYQLYLVWMKLFSTFDPEDPISWITLLEAQRPKLSRVGSQKNWSGKQEISIAREQLTSCFKQVENLERQISAQIIKEVQKIAQHFQKKHAQIKMHDGWMDPDDLLTFTKKLLCNQDAWQNISSSFDYVFVDEFQDTDPLQAEIIWRLLSSSFVNHKDFFSATIRPNCLTVVGDPQQSIYRFRHASIETFFKVSNQIQETGGKRYVIDQNFRSSKPIIDFVNARFSQIQHFTPLVARPYSGRPCVHVIENIDIPEKLPLGDLRELDALHLAGRLSKVLLENTEIKPQDCALLLPTFSHVQVYEKALAEYFPTVKERRSTHLHPIFSSVISLLTFLENPHIEYNLMAVLRTPFFFTDLQSLLDQKKVTGNISLENLHDTDISKRLHVYLAWYQKSAYYFFEKWLHEVTPTLKALSKNIVQEIQILTWAHQQIYYFESKSVLEKTLVEYLRTRFIKEFIPEDPENKSIRIMTIHQSKGLEFPIVALGGLYSQAMMGQKYFTQPETGLSEVSFAPFSSWLYSEGFESLKESEKIAHLEEKKRLLYVAITRAKTHLLVTHFDFQSRQKTFADLLWQSKS